MSFNFASFFRLSGRIVTVGFGAWIALADPALAQGRLAVSGTTVSLVPAEGFAAATGFSGLQNPQTHATLVVAEMPPVAHAQVSKLFETLDAAKTNFAKQNVLVQTIEQIDIAGGKAPLITGSQDVAGTRFDKWISLIKGDRTVIVTVQSPRTAGLKAAEVKAMLSTIALGAEPGIADKLSALPFRIGPAEPFRIVDVLGGSTIIMTAGPLDVDPAATQPMLIVSYQLSGRVAADKLQATAEELLKTTRGFGTASVESRQAVRFAGRDAIVIAGSHTSASGAAKRFAHYMAIGESARYLRMIVSADAARFDALQPAIKAIVDSAAFADRP